MGFAELYNSNLLIKQTGENQENVEFNQANTLAFFTLEEVKK